MWLEPYINSNTACRGCTRKYLEKDFFKLMNNLVFSKTMENIRKHKDIRLVTTYAKFIKLLMKSNFKSRIRFGDSFFMFEMGNIKVVMNKLVYLGQAILDLSKMVMYRFHYDYLLPKFGDRIALCYMDTDSFVYCIQTEDFYMDIATDVDLWLDTSTYSHSNARPLPIGQNEKIVGLVKDKLRGKIMTWFTGLRSKSYACKMLDGSEGKCCKGVKCCVVAKTIAYKDFEHCLLEGVEIF